MKNRHKKKVPQPRMEGMPDLLFSLAPLPSVRFIDFPPEFTPSWYFDNWTTIMYYDGSDLFWWDGRPYLILNFSAS